MTHPHDAVRVQPVLIDAEGQIEVFGLRYWSEESTKFSLRAVTLCVAHTPHQRAAVLSLKGELLCHVELVDDGGLADRREEHRTEAQALIDEAEREARDIEADARASIVRGQAEMLIDLIDHRIENAFITRRIFRRFEGMLAFCRGEGPLRDAWRAFFGGTNMSNGDVAQGRQSGFQIAKAIFEHPHAVFGGHGHRDASVSVGDGEQAKRAAEAGHCLSEVAK